MSPFQRAREEALRIRSELVPGRERDAVPARELLNDVEARLKVSVELVAPGFADLGGGSACLHRRHKYICISNAFHENGDEYCALLAHELGHFFLDADETETTPTTIGNALGEATSQAVRVVEAYGARERKELQANVFARELLLPRDVARNLAGGIRETAHALGVPAEIVRQQLLDGRLLPQGSAGYVTLKQASADQECAARAREKYANVVAGPGTGKTSTLIHRVTHLVRDRGVDPSQILVLTFTNKAALELVERLRTAGIERASDVWAGTFHAFGLEFIRKYHQYFGLDDDPRVADKLASLMLLAAQLPRLELRAYSRLDDPYDWLSPIVEGIKRLKEELVDPATYRARIQVLPASSAEIQARREDLATLYEAHEHALASTKSVDFVDLVARPTLALQADRAKYSELADRFQHVLVDEYQDVTEAMRRMLLAVAKNAQSLWVVGDIRQAIHHWRGASLKSLLRFRELLERDVDPSLIEEYALDFNRRSHSEVLALIEDVGRRHVLEESLPLASMTATSGPCGDVPTMFACEDLSALHDALRGQVLALNEGGLLFRQQAVLGRSAEEVDGVVRCLSEAGIPVVHVGTLSRRPEIKTLLCLMQLLVERSPTALVGLMGAEGLNMPWPDIALLIEATTSDVRFQRGRWIANPPAGLSADSLAVVRRLQEILKAKNRYTSPWTFVSDLILDHGIGLPPPNDDSIAAAMQRIACWQFCYQVRSKDEPRSARLSRFLLRHRLRERSKDTMADRELPVEASCLDGVRVSTVHASKGLEFDAVHVACATEESYGAAPPQRSGFFNPLELVPPEVLGSSQAEYDHESAVERNNLLYVAVSRARRYVRLYSNRSWPHQPPPQVSDMHQAAVRSDDRTRRSTSPTTTMARAFATPAGISFEDFFDFNQCGRRYFYRRVLGLHTDDDLHPALRARGALRIALRDVALKSADPNEAIAQAWEVLRLPLAGEDPALWRAAQEVYRRGVELVAAQRRAGARIVEAETIVNDVRFALPWGFLTIESGRPHLSLLIHRRHAFDEVQRFLRPTINGLQRSGVHAMSVRFLHHLAVPPEPIKAAVVVEKTAAYMAAERLRAGLNVPRPNRQCSRCSFLTICPHAPVRV